MDIPNLHYINELSAGDLYFKQKFIAILVEEFPKEKITYETAIRALDYKGAVQIVHKLKHKFNILSMTSSYILAVEHEEALKVESIKFHVPFGRALLAIEEFLKSF